MLGTCSPLGKHIQCSTNGMNYIRYVINAMNACPVPLAGRETVLGVLLVSVEPLLV